MEADAERLEWKKIVVAAVVVAGHPAMEHLGDSREGTGQQLLTTMTLSEVECVRACYDGPHNMRQEVVFA